MEERKSSRIATECKLMCRSRSLDKPVTVWNLSETGCLVEYPDSFLEAGDNVELAFLTGVTGGSVIWTTDGFAGIAFFEPLHAAVVAHLDVGRHAAISQDHTAIPHSLERLGPTPDSLKKSKAS